MAQLRMGADGAELIFHFSRKNLWELSYYLLCCSASRDSRIRWRQP